MRTTVTLLIPTRDRPDNVEFLLRSLRHYGYLSRPNFDILVVEGSNNADTQSVCSRYGAKFLPADHRPKSAAMNYALDHITSDFVAFLDDDIVILDEHWLDKLLRNFSIPEVAYVSGKVVAYELNTAAQIKWEKKGALNKGDRRLEFGPEFFHKWRLIGVPTTLFTMGANHLVRKSALDAVGAHDARFGPGCSVGGASADHDLTYKILRCGYQVIYDPEAKVAHRHPEDMADLRSRIFNYGIADTAIHTKFLVEYRDLRSAGQLIYRPAQQFWRLVRSIVGKYPLPADVLLLGIIGNVIGPFAYAWVDLMTRCPTRSCREKTVT